MERNDEWEPAAWRVRRICNRHSIFPKLGADAHVLIDELTDLLLSAEREGFDAAIDALREQCLLRSHQPETVTQLRAIEEILLARRRIVYAAQGQEELILTPP